jgi:O-antigen/teichoic acid export membrane protein
VTSRPFRRIVRSDFVRHGAIVFTGLIVANVLNYLYYVLCGRVLGVEGYGELNALTSAVLTLAAPANVAQIVVAKLAAELIAAGDRRAADRLAATAVRGTLWLALGIAAASALFVVPLERFFHVASPWPILLAAVSLGLFAAITVQRGALQGAGRFGAFSASYCIEAAVRTGAGVALAVRFGPLGALVGLLLGVLVCYGYDAVLLRGRPGAPGSASGLAGLRVSYVAGRIGLAQLMLTVLSFYDVVLARNVFGARDAGLYAAAALVGRVMLGLLAFVPTLLMPKATARARAGAAVLPLFAGAAGVALAIAAAGALAAAAAPAGIVTLFAGRKFAAAAPIVSVYVLAAGALGLANVVAAYQFGLHRFRFVVPASAVGLAEIVTVALWHPTPVAMAGVLLAGHAAFLATTLLGIGATAAEPAGEPGRLSVADGGL